MSVLRGDCMEVMQSLDAKSIDAIVTDPPYGISFLGRPWDDLGELHEYGKWCEQWAREAYRVLKPGGHLLAFGGSRTYHRLASGIEDAGFEIRDQLMWVYASGFPKSQNLDGEWSGWGTALKPAHEPIVLARKPLVGTVAANMQAYGTGALNIDDCRMEGVPPSVPQPRFANVSGHAYLFRTPEGRNGDMSSASGRWPANVLLTDPVFDGSAEDVVGGGMARSAKTPAAPGWKGGGIFGESGQGPIYADTGTYSRFFLIPKAPKRERTSDKGVRSPHPTQKPEQLIRHLVRLITPPGGLVLDPFLGSGTLGVVCQEIGIRWIGIEREEAYADWAEQRIMERKTEWERSAE